MSVASAELNTLEQYIGRLRSLLDSLKGLSESKPRKRKTTDSTDATLQLMLDQYGMPELLEDLDPIMYIKLNLAIAQIAIANQTLSIRLRGLPLDASHPLVKSRNRLQAFEEDFAAKRNVSIDKDAATRLIKHYTNRGSEVEL